MAPPEDKPRSERAQTDESLEAERRKTDVELDATRVRVAQEADAVVVEARRVADEVLESARSRADDEKASARRPRDEAADQEVRRTEDAVLAEERSTADATLAHEREERERALKALLKFERETTDAHLMTERDVSDSSVSSRDRFLAIVSHDLRTMLGGIALNAALLTREATPDELGRKVLKRAEAVQRGTARMSRLIGDLVDVVSIEIGKLHVAPVPSDALKPVRETIETFQPLASATQIELSAELPAATDEPIVALVDTDRFLQVLANLVSNAVKFTPPGGRVVVKVERQAAELLVSVVDTGSGVPPTESEAIFGRFAQGSNRAHGGLGLGLYISKCVVEAHGGRIWLERTSPAGSTFCVALPLAPA